MYFFPSELGGLWLAGWLAGWTAWAFQTAFPKFRKEEVR